MRAPRPIPPPPLSSVEARRELDVHRHELFAQNEELRHANQELIAARDRYATLYDGAPMAYFTLDDAGVIVEANVAAGRLLAASRSLLFGRRFEDIVVPALRRSFRTFQTRLRTETASLAHETSLVLGSRRLPVRVEGARIAAEPGRLLVHLCVTDESDRVRREVERRSFLAREAETSRLESLGMLADGVARDFEEIARGLLEQSDILQIDGGDLVARDTAARIRLAAGRAGDLSTQLAAYCGRAPVREEPLDLSSLIADMANALSRVAEEGVTIVFELGSDLPLVSGDRVRLRQLVTNLVRNAVEAIGQGRGRIVLRTQQAPIGPVGRPRGILLECTDDGRGMDSHTARHAFDPFFTTKTNARGLGLAVVHGTVRAHRGTVSIDERFGVGAGARICVLLPAREDPTETLDSDVAAPGRAY